MAESLYLGRVFDPITEETGADFRLDPSDLTTHGIVIGMTGSGKTGLSIVAIEEALQNDIPVIIIDPKGDMANLALAFGDLRPQDFAPWLESNGSAGEQVADSVASTWREGLSQWGITGADVSAYVSRREVKIITPGSTSGTPLNLIESLEPPSEEVLADEEDFRDQVDGSVTALLGLIGIKPDPIESQEYILLSTLIEASWRNQRALTLEALIGQVANPPFDKIGALSLDVVYPPAERNKLMLALNNLLASPGLAAWRQGESVDIDAWLRTNDGRPQATIIYTAHLDEEQRIFVTALLLNKLVSWVRRQPGSSDLRCLLYMDEIFGYFPPTANPPTKKPLLTLLKQARAYGLGVLLSTQNPVDLDYRGLANMGFWAIGRLQTSQDQARIRSGIEAALADSNFTMSFDDLIAGVQKRVFLIHDIHRKKPELVYSRWAKSYLRGPITRDELERLQITAKPETLDSVERTESASGPTVSTSPDELRGQLNTPPRLPPPLYARFLDLRGGNLATPHLIVKAAVRYKVGRNKTPESTHTLGFRLDTSLSPAETLSTTPLELGEENLTDAAEREISFGDLPSYLDTDAKPLERAMRDRLDDCMTIDLLYDPQTKLVSQPNESSEAFAERIINEPKLVAKRRKLESRLASKQASLISKQSEVKSRGMEKWVSVGTSLLSNIGLFTGRKRTVTGLGGVLSKQRMETKARSNIERLKDEVERLSADILELEEVDDLRFETKTVKPYKTDVAIIRYDIVWVT